MLTGSCVRHSDPPVMRAALVTSTRVPSVEMTAERLHPTPSSSRSPRLPLRAALATCLATAHVQVAFEDDDYFFAIKPPGLICAGGEAGSDSFHEQVKAHAVAAYGHRPRLLHRLDKGTSGIMAYAKSDAAAALGSSACAAASTATRACRNLRAAAGPAASRVSCCSREA